MDKHGLRGNPPAYDIVPTASLNVKFEHLT